MKTVGKQLQDARLVKNWTPEMAARETKIKVDRLRDLEIDDYSHFTSPTYARGFVRTYARALGLDEYKILRQLDNKLPDDDTPNIVTESGITYLPETALPPRVAHRDFTGLYIVMALGFIVTLIIGFVLFQAYRVGELPGYSSETPVEATTKSGETNSVPVTVPESTPHALPVDPNDTSSAPKAQPVDLSTGTSTDTNVIPVAPIAPPEATNVTPTVTTPSAPPRALPVDLSQLANDTNTVPKANPVLEPSQDPPVNARKALPVDPSELSNAVPVAVPVASPSVAPVSNPDSPLAPMVQSPAPSDAKTPPRALPVDPNELTAPNSETPVVPPTTNTVIPATQDTNQPVATPAPVTPTVGVSPGNSLVLTATQDSFVRVMAIGGPGNPQPLYSAVLRTGQSVGFNGRKFSVHVGLPSAVNMKLDGVNYGPHSTSEDPETFTVESHQP